MDTFFQVLAAISGPIIGITTGILLDNKRKTKAKTKAKSANEAETMLDDISYIQEIKHLHGNAGNVVWQQYDILLAAQHYDWETIVVLIKKYVETVIRRTFGTKDAMKLAKPIPKE